MSDARQIKIDRLVPAATPSVPHREKRRYHVGTLSYTRRGLVILFAWVLWGDFCFTLMEAVVPSILPIKLKALGSSNFTMVLIMSTMPNILNATTSPWVSFWSDRYRGRWGRRIPFIFFTLPFLTLFLILLGFSQQIGTAIHQVAFAQNGLLSATTVTVFLIGVFMVGFQFFNMFVSSVYWYLFNDVVPEHFIGQFLGLFRMVGSLTGILYNYFIFKYAETHMTEIFAGAALLYFFGFGLMCLRVKEGKYPPPPEYIDGQRGIVAGIKTFFVECFSIRFYWFVFGMTAGWAISGCANIFKIFFFRDIGLTLAQIGTLNACAGFVGMILTYPAGIVADKYHPLRVLFVMKLILLVSGPLNLIFLFVHLSPQAAYYYCLITSLAILPASLLYGASELPTLMRIFPKERFGQFCSAMAMINSIGTLLGGLTAGLVFDGFKWYYNGSDFAYRWIPAWAWFFQILAMLCLVNVYRGWKRYGGLKNYVPPLPLKPDQAGPQ